MEISTYGVICEAFWRCYGSLEGLSNNMALSFSQCKTPSYFFPITVFLKKTNKPILALC